MDGLDHEGAEDSPADDPAHAELERIYDGASRLSPDERQAYLDAECAGNEVLRKEVEMLIAFEPELDSLHHGKVRGHLREIGDSAGTSEALEDPTDWLPDRIGSYQIQRQIGRGGMGVVLEALQESPRRRVALKLIHPMVATEAALQRLQNEAEFLGRLHHPGIAQVYEAGVHPVKGQVQPYFAMEYIDGETLLRHASEQGLDRRARIELLITICEAVQHAHDEGVVHRDLKPDNILVDSLGQPKLLDFGVARLVEETDSASALRTQAGELLGTLAYMAPEQSAGDLSKITPATDVFALGVIAFELLSGRIPRQLREMPMTAALDAVSQMEPMRLREAVSSAERDLDTVVGKALELRPDSRYRSASDLAADLRNILDRRPIVARPPSAWDQVTKFVRRNKLLVAAVSAILASLMVALVLAIRDAQREAMSRRSTLRDLYASEMLRATDASSRASGMVKLGDSLSRWVPAKGDPDLRGWEWRYLMGIEQDKSVSIPLPSFGMAVDWHPSGKTLAVASVMKVDIYDAETAEPIGSWLDPPPASRFLTGVRFSPDGERILFHGWYVLGVMQVGATQPDWLVEGGRHIAGAWSPDGATVVVTDAVRRRVVRYDAATGAELTVFPDVLGTLEFRNITADGRRTGSVSRDVSPHILDLEFGTRGSPLHEGGQVPMCLMINEAGTHVAESGWNNLIRIYSLTNPDAALEIREHNEQVDCVDWHPSEPLIASGAGDASVRTYNANLGTLMEVHRGHTDRVRCVRWSPDGTKLASSSDDNTLRIWDVTAKKAYRRRTLESDGTPLFDLNLSCRDGGSTVYGSHLSGSFHVSLDDAALEEHDHESSMESFSTDGELRSSVRRRDEGFEIVVTRTEDDGEIWSRSGEVNTLNVRSWHPEQRKLLVGGPQGFEMVDFSSEPRSMWKQPVDLNLVKGGTFDRKAQHVVLMEKQKSVRVCSVATGEVVTLIPLPKGVLALDADFSPDGARLALACSDGDVRLHDAATGEPVELLRGHAGKVLSVRWHPTERRLATGSADGSLKLWNTSTFVSTASFDCGGAVAALTWNDDGGTLIGMTTAGVIHLWEALGEG